MIIYVQGSVFYAEPCTVNYVVGPFCVHGSVKNTEP
jgi:hypothetical protein